MAQFCGVDGDRDEERAANIDEPLRRSQKAQLPEARDGLHAPRAGNLRVAVRVGQAKNPTGYGAFLWLVALLQGRVLVKAAPKKKFWCGSPQVRSFWLVFRPAARAARASGL